MKIALDAMGGDFAPSFTLEGAKLALQELPPESTLVLLGNEEVISGFLKKEDIALDGQSSRADIEIIHAREVINMGEHPIKAISQKPNSSIALGFGLLKKREIDAFCSAGNTGAMQVGAMFTVRAIEGVIRPGIAGFIPKISGGYGIIMDVGANADCKADVLSQFGTIAYEYAKHTMKVENPKVGLVNLGAEESKGTLLTQAAYKLLDLNKKINFIGNIEGSDLFNDKADVIICDGFTGNVILKLAESIYDILSQKRIKDPYFDQFNYEAIGGSPILGLNGNVVIGHGRSTALAIKNMILQSYQMAYSNVYKKIKDTLEL